MACDHGTWNLELYSCGIHVRTALQHKQQSARRMVCENDWVVNFLFAVSTAGEKILRSRRGFSVHCRWCFFNFFCCKINKNWRRKWEKSSQQNNMLFTLYPDARRDSKIRTYILSLENFAQEESRDFYNKIWQMCQKKNEKKGNMNIPILPFLSLLLHIATSIPSSAPCIQSNQSYGTRTWEKHEWCLFSF